MSGKKDGFEKKDKGFLFGLFKKKTDASENQIPDDVQIENETTSIAEKDLYADLPNNLKINKESPVYKIWDYWIDESKPEFNPLEFILEDLSEMLQISKDDVIYIKKNEEYQHMISNIIISSETVLREVSKEQMLIKIKENSDADSVLLQNQNDDSQYKNLKAFGGIDDISELSKFDHFKEFISENDSKELIEAAKKIIPDKSGNEAAASEDSNEIHAVDAQPNLYVSQNKMQAWIFIYPPRNGGNDITMEKIRDLLDANKIVYGVDNSALSKIGKKHMYLKIIEIARGIECIDGKDGQIIDIVPREEEVSIKENDEGKINFKELNLIRSIHRGDKICEIIYPTEPKNGTDINGKEVKGIAGKMPTIPKGANTRLSEDGTKLEADMDGYIHFDKGVYTIQNLLTIQGDVDVSVGNINFAGDILIKGKVREGFSVISDGNITIKGNVEPGATIKAGGSLVIERGINGGARGYIEAKGKIKIKYIENCRVSCGDSIETEVIIDSVIECDNALNVVRGRGTIVGGKLTVGKQIDVKVIGNENNSGRQTEITLGFMPNIIKERNEIKKRLDEINEALEKLTTNINYIERYEETLDEGRKKLLAQLRVQVPLRQMEKAKYEKLYDSANKMLESIGYCRLRAGIVYPVVSLKLGPEVQTIHEIQKNFSVSISTDKAKN